MCLRAVLELGRRAGWTWVPELCSCWSHKTSPPPSPPPSTKLLLYAWAVLHHKAGLAGNYVSRTYNHVTKEYNCLYCTISWAAMPCEIQHKQREPGSWKFLLRARVPGVICVPVCMSTVILKITERIKPLTPLMGNSWQGTGHQGWRFLSK